MEVEANGVEVDDQIENGRVRLNEMATKYIQDLMAEKSRMENQYPLAQKLIDDALEKVHTTGRIPTREQYADVYQQKTIKLSQKVHVPIKDKKFNYVGKLLGPKGNSLRRLQEETQCKIVILGRFSMKDRAREEELRNSTDTKYAHLNLPLHVEISTIAPPAEAYARVAYALAEIRKYLIPDKHDDIRQEQLRELMADPEAAKKIAQRAQMAAANPKPQYQQQILHQNYNNSKFSS